MEIVTTILWALLALIILILVVLLIFLWQRVHYEFAVQKYEGMATRVKIDWAWELLAAQARYDSGAGLFWEVKWPFGGMNSHPESKAEGIEARAKQMEEQAKEGKQRRKKANEDAETIPQKADERAEAAKADADYYAEEERLPKKTDPDVAAEWDRLEREAERHRERQEARDEDDKAKPQPGVKDYLGLVRYALAQDILQPLATYLSRLWGRAKPRYAEGEATVGLADPYTQGLLMGAMYASLPALASRTGFVFNEEVVEGRFRTGGGIRPLAVVWDSLRLVCAAPVRKTAWYYWRHVINKEE